MKGKFLPFHSGHEASISDVKNDTDCKVFLIVTTPRTKQFEISKDFHRAMMDEVVNNNPNICGYSFADGRSWNEISKNIPTSYNPKFFSGNLEECEDIASMNDDIKTMPSTRHMSSSSVIQKIKDEDYDGYKKLVPSYLHNHFYKLRNELTHEQ